MWCKAGTDLEAGMVCSESTRDGRSRSDILLGPERSVELIIVYLRIMKTTAKKF